MHKLHAGYRIALTLLAVTFVLGLAASASADTIYLKNGRVIRSSSVRVEGDRVIFVQYAGEVSIPLVLVDRIVQDASVEPEGAPPPPVAVADTNPDDEGLDPEAEPEDGLPEQTRQYWQDRVRAIEAETAEVEVRIEDLRRTERAFLFSSRSTADTRREIEDQQANLTRFAQEMDDLRAEARRMQIPAGWLRLTPAGGQGGLPQERELR